MKDIRIAVVTDVFKVGRVKENLDTLSHHTAAAADENAGLICFPEMCITGYQSGPGIRDWAEPIPGTASQFIENLARKHRITILAGMAEIDHTGRIFASHLVCGPDGRMDIYRKLHLGPPEKTTFSPGNAIPLFATPSITFGIQLCYDAHFPELATAMAVKGADAVFIPHASPGGTPKAKKQSWLRHLRARAFDNSIFIIACNPVGENGRGLTFPGVILVIGPSGHTIAEYTGDTEHLLIADLKADDLKSVRDHQMRYFLPNRRPELY